jgi:hypothetical protein
MEVGDLGVETRSQGHYVVRGCEQLQDIKLTILRHEHLKY